MFTGTNDMKQQKVIETLLSKKEQISLATQVELHVLSMVIAILSGCSYDSENRRRPGAR